MSVVAISYDPPATLSRFARKHGIEYPLLSDPGSKTIDAWSLRNPDVPFERMKGVPHPGTFLLDASGTIRARLFYDGYKQRHATREIVDAAKGLD